MNKFQKDIRAAIVAVLSSDEGVQQEAYEQLLILGEHLPDKGTSIFKCVDATDGSFYLPEGFEIERE